MYLFTKLYKLPTLNKYTLFVKVTPTYRLQNPLERFIKTGKNNKQIQIVTVQIQYDLTM